MTANLVNLLTIEDDPAIRRLLRTSLSNQSYRVFESETGKGALTLLAQKDPEVVLLDLGLPDIDGLEVIRWIRAKSRVPIIVLSARGDVRSKVAALELGADDYVTKPFSMDELVARMRAAQRHRYAQKGEEPIFCSGDLTVDLVRRRVIVAGNEVKLSPTEFSLLRLFVLHAGMVLTHQQISHEVWKDDKDVQYVRVYVRQLRKKIEVDTQLPYHIVTEPGVGYRLQTPS